jgi:hypothetical protein
MKTMSRRTNAERRLCRRASGEGGQSLVESCFVIILLCLIFFGFLQVGILYNHERVLQLASFISARSATVGFNEEVYSRAYRAAAVAASGHMEAPFSNISEQEQLRYEAPRNIDGLIGRYINPLNSRGILDYQYWDPYQMEPNITAGGTTLQETHKQAHPMEILRDSGLLRVFFDTDTIRFPSDVTMGCHYSYYLSSP